VRPATEGTRRLGVACAIAFAASSAFPIVASLMTVSEMPRLLGIADVAIAAVLVAIALTTQSRGTALVRDDHRQTAYVVIRAGSAAALVLLALFLIGRPQIKWDVLVVGLVWRGWLLVHVLPALAAALRSPSNVRKRAS
jgi:hypothetical protein